MISLSFLRINLVSLSIGLMIIMSEQARADRHCSLGIGLIEIAIAELNNLGEMKDACSTTREQVSEWLITIVEDFEVCGCALPKSVSSEVKRFKQLPCKESSQIQLETLNNLDQVAKNKCGY